MPPKEGPRGDGEDAAARRVARPQPLAFSPFSCVPRSLWYGVRPALARACRLSTFAMISTLRRFLCLSLTLAAPCVAQWPQPGQNPQQGGFGQGGRAGETGVIEWPPRQDPNQLQNQVQQPLSPFSNQQPGFPGVQPTNPDFRGFPALNQTRRGFGAYPNYPGFTPSTDPSQPFAPPVGRLRPPGLWPSWLTEGRSEEDARARPERALLVRFSERVWYRAADEAVYVPLPFHDKVRELEAGAAVQVRTASGELTLTFHDGATLRAQGIINFDVRILNEAAGELEVRDLRRVWVGAKQRMLRLRLPDTSTIEAMDAQIYLARIDERVVVRNYGPAIATLRSPVGTVDLGLNQQVQILMTPVPTELLRSTLSVQGTVRAKIEGRTLVVDGGNEGGSVDWSGARVRVGVNERATLDALDGDSFPEYRPASNKSQAPAAPPERTTPSGR